MQVPSPRLRETFTVGIGVVLAAVCGYLSQSLLLFIVLGGAFGVALLTIFILHPKWGVLLLVSLFGLGTYSNFGGTLSIYGITSLAVTGAWLMSSALTHRIEIPHSRIAAMAIAFLLLCAISLTWAHDVQRGINWLVPLAQGTIMALLIGVLFRSRRDIHLLVGTMVVSTGFGVGWGAFQEYIFRTEGWRAYYSMNIRGTGAVTIGDSARISGTYFNPASLATYALVALVFATHFSSASGNSRSRLFWLGLSGLFAWGVLATLSRAPIIVLMLLVPVFAWFFRSHKKVFVPIAIVLVLVLAQFAPKDLFSRLSTVSDFGSTTTSNGERLFLLQSGVRMIADHPLLGVGYANFPVRIGEYMGIHQFDFAARDAHNVVIEVTAENGIIGLAVFAAMIAATYAALVRCARASFSADLDFVPNLSLISMVALTSMLLVGLATPIRADRYLYFIIGLAMACEALRDARATVPTASTPFQYQSLGAMLRSTPRAPTVPM